MTQTFAEHCARYQQKQEISAQISVLQLILENNPSERHWFLAASPQTGGDADAAVLAFFAKDRRVQPYSRVAWQQTSDSRRVSYLKEKATGDPGYAVAVESVTWKTRLLLEVKVAFWNDDTGLAHGPVYTVVRTGRGWVVDSARTGYWGQVP